MTPRSEVVRFADVMEAKLAKNDHKGGSAAWRKENWGYLFGRLNQEVEELSAAIGCYLEDSDPKALEREAADVANFAMMIADKARNG